MLMTAAEYRESLRRLKPRVFVDGRAVASVADDPALQPGVNAVGLSYDFALRDDTASLMRVSAADEGGHNRMLHVPRSEDELLQKLEAVRLICRYTGCAQPRSTRIMAPATWRGRAPTTSTCAARTSPSASP